MEGKTPSTGGQTRPAPAAEREVALTFRFKATDFNLRLFSALVLAPLVLGIVWIGGSLYNVLVVAVMLVALYEWIRLTIKKPTQTHDLVAGVGLLAVLLVAWFGKTLWAFELLPLTLLAFFYFVQDKDNVAPGWLRRAFWAVFGLFYMALSGISLIEVRDLSGVGRFGAVYLLAVVWTTDIGAYFVGSFIGGPKILPRISPKKTWAGLFGGMALAGAIGYAVAYGFEDSKSFKTALVAVGLAVVAQAGDLLESYIKRRRGVKDSGALIPGHGGLLDRIDGLLLASIVMFGLVSIGRG